MLGNSIPIICYNCAKSVGTVHKRENNEWIEKIIFIDNRKTIPKDKVCTCHKDNQEWGDLSEFVN